MFREVKAQFGKLDIFVANARPEAAEFFQPPYGHYLATLGRSIRFPSQSILGRGARGESSNAGGREDPSHDLRPGKPDRRPAALGGDGLGKGGSGVTRPLFRGGAGETWRMPSVPDGRRTACLPASRTCRNSSELGTSAGGPLWGAWERRRTSETLWPCSALSKPAGSPDRSFMRMAARH